jgi:hypothetical protein
VEMLLEAYFMHVDNTYNRYHKGAWLGRSACVWCFCWGLL